MMDELTPEKQFELASMLLNEAYGSDLPVMPQLQNQRKPSGAWSYNFDRPVEPAASPIPAPMPSPSASPSPAVDAVKKALAKKSLQKAIQSKPEQAVVGPEVMGPPLPPEPAVSPLPMQEQSVSPAIELPQSILPQAKASEVSSVGEPSKIAADLLEKKRQALQANVSPFDVGGIKAQIEAAYPDLTYEPKTMGMGEALAGLIPGLAGLVLGGKEGGAIGFKASADLLSAKQKELADKNKLTQQGLSKLQAQKAQALSKISMLPLEQKYKMETLMAVKNADSENQLGMALFNLAGKESLAKMENATKEQLAQMKNSLDQWKTELDASLQKEKLSASSGEAKAKLEQSQKELDAKMQQLQQELKLKERELDIKEKSVKNKKKEDSKVIPGFSIVEGAEPTQDDIKKVKLAASKTKVMHGFLDNLINKLDQSNEVPLTNLSGIGSELDSSYQNLVLEAKEVANLGALTGPDMGLLRSQLIPPTGPKAKLLGKDAIIRNYKEAKKLLDSKLEAASEPYGFKPIQKAQSAEMNRTPVYTTKNGQQYFEGDIANVNGKRYKVLSTGLEEVK